MMYQSSQRVSEKEKEESLFSSEAELKEWLSGVRDKDPEDVEFELRNRTADLHNSKNVSVEQINLLKRAFDEVVKLFEEGSIKLDTPQYLYLHRATLDILTKDYFSARENLSKVMELSRVEYQDKLDRGITMPEFPVYFKERYQQVSAFKMVEPIVGAMPDNHEFQKLSQGLEPVELSDFWKNLFEYNKADVEKVDRVRLEVSRVVSKIVSDVRTLKNSGEIDLDDPKSVLPIISSLGISMLEGGRGPDQDNVLDNIVLHRLDCDAASLLMLEAGKQLGLPIELRGALVNADGLPDGETQTKNKELHVFIAWVDKAGNDSYLYEAVRENRELKGMGVEGYDLKSSFLKDRVKVDANLLLSIQYLASNENLKVWDDYQKYVSGLGLFGQIDLNNPKVEAVQDMLKTALEISPDNLDVWVRSGKYTKALEVAQNLGGTTLKEWYRKQIQGDISVQIIMPLPLPTPESR